MIKRHFVFKSRMKYGELPEWAIDNLIFHTYEEYIDEESVFLAVSYVDEYGNMVDIKDGQTVSLIPEHIIVRN